MHQCAGGVREAQFIGTIYDAIRKRQTLVIEYQSFKALQPQAVTAYPFLLKEYRNRWFLICEMATNITPQVNIFALDRIHSVSVDKEHPFKECIDFDPTHFFDDTIGVTRLIGDKAQHVVVRIDGSQAPYVETKPFHRSQRGDKSPPTGASSCR